ncbi:MAG: crossover junction endodeoxyribonuclease RuvC [Planctomycetota bacterium]|nr:crossover junction endodeoxyribonuclease RuvC [Planctomycetota bacterium]
MRILGIDPGLRLTGYGCVDLRDDEVEPTLVEAGVLRLDATQSIAFRLHQLHVDLTQVIEELSPDLMVVEKLFSHYKHVQTSILMGHARGVILLAGQAKGVEIDELSATEVKKAISGHGHATKQQMQTAVMTQCGLSEPPSPPDVADAIAIALCAARRIQVNS